MQYLWGVILVKQARITIKRKIIEKKEHKPIKTLLYTKVRKQNKLKQLLRLNKPVQLLLKFYSFSNP